MSEQTYFPYHPLRWRVTLLGAAVLSLGLTLWACVGWYRGGGVLEAGRAALSLGMLLAIASVVFRLRPRSDWGVRVGPTVLTVARAGATRGHVDIPWSAVREIRRLGRARDTLVVFLSDDRRVLVPRHLFPHRSDFEALVAAIEEKMPPLPYDA